MAKHAYSYQKRMKASRRQEKAERKRERKFNHNNNKDERSITENV